ncbi:MAG: glucosaminidase domain-containing protein [Dysgonamonadaceae bacterium]|jgi:hypothetical protein|nr:glucosaminidase domain-containing protein [Dysgonamonadaceae bacterium]
MKTNIHKILTLFFLLCAGTGVQAQQQLKSHLDYIAKHKKLAINHMERYKIPASITLAQALLESGAGKSELARSSNNHFGIKCHSNWEGKRIFRQDDNPNDCFRVYKKVAESYEDHSNFIYNRPRYSVLFSYDITDYKAWARGLQKCGYATDKAYADKLIRSIETYQLYVYDSKSKKKGKKDFDELRRIRPTYITHGLLYVEAEADDSFDKIAYDMGFKAKNLRKYNDVPKDFPLQKGDIVYLEMKKKKADVLYYIHTVKAGDSMHGISQRYGIRLKNLYQLNGKDPDYVPTEGDALTLR